MFSIGTIVKLKGTKMLMTVSRIYFENNSYECTWFDREDQLNTYNFSGSELEE